MIPAVAAYRRVLIPAGLGIAAVAAWLLRWLIVVPLGFLWRRVLVPPGREVLAALVIAWRVAGYVSRAVERGLKWLVRVLVVVPAAWAWHSVVRPVWRPVTRALAEAREAVRGGLAAARDTVRRTCADMRAALFGTPPPELTRPRAEPEGRNPQ